MEYINQFTFVGINKTTKQQFGFTEQQLVAALDDAGDFEWDAEDIADILSDIHGCVVRVEDAGYEIGSNNETEPNTQAQIIAQYEEEERGYDRLVTTSKGSVIAASKHSILEY